jgi:hypothetical protein
LPSCPILEALERARQSSLLEVEHRRQLGSRDRRVLADEPEDHPLLGGDAHRVVHALRRGPQRVVERPELAHEAQRRLERLLADHARGSSSTTEEQATT